VGVILPARWFVDWGAAFAASDLQKSQALLQPRCRSYEPDESKDSVFVRRTFRVTLRKNRIEGVKIYGKRDVFRNDFLCADFPFFFRQG